MSPMKCKSRGGADKLSLDLTTWPPKFKRLAGCPNSGRTTEDEDSSRPRTATLDKPRVLDAGLLGRIDMTRITRRGLLALAGVVEPPLTEAEFTPRKRSHRLNRTFRVPSLNRSSVSEECFVRPVIGEDVPEPCRTCGRAEFPERLHSHPKSKQDVDGGGANKFPVTAAAPCAVRRPVPIRYRPRRALPPPEIDSPTLSPQTGKTTRRKFVCYICGRDIGSTPLELHEPVCLKRWVEQNGRLPLQLHREPPRRPSHHLTAEDWNREAALSAQPKRSDEDYALVVYQAGREEEGNCESDSDYRASGPVRCELLEEEEEEEQCREVLRTNWFHLKSEEYLEANSIQCPNCLRRFSPDNLVNHERSCFKRQHVQAVQGSGAPDLTRNSPLIECFLCGKKFGTHSIGIHEPQCLKKWKLQHGEQTPPENPRRAVNAIKNRALRGLKAAAAAQRTSTATDSPASASPSVPKPVSNSTAAANSSATEQRERVRSAWADLLTSTPPQPSRSEESSAGKHVSEPAISSPQTTNQQAVNPQKPVLCQLCGKAFAVSAFPAHQKICVAMLKSKNTKHPQTANARRNTEKSGYVFKGSERADSAMQAAWKSHLAQLIPCRKCGRTFNPDRVAIHERCCHAGAGR